MSISRIFDCVIGKSVKCERARRAFGISSIFYTAHSFPSTFRTWFAWAIYFGWITTGSNCLIAWSGTTMIRSAIGWFYANTTGKTELQRPINFSNEITLTCNSNRNLPFLLVYKYFQLTFHRGNIRFRHNQNHVYKWYLQGTIDHWGHIQNGKVHLHNNGHSSKCLGCSNPCNHTDLDFLGYI